jgi:uncharacterized repeat protein (TIGR03803 family)
MSLIKLRLLHCSVAGAIIAGVVTGAPGMARAWTYHYIHRFKGGPSDGASPEGGLVADSQGRLYGTTYAGGPSGVGVVFRLDPPTSGLSTWTEEILHTFSGADGAYPTGDLVLDSGGSLYGTTLQGGGTMVGSEGVVFKLANAPGWPIQILHIFKRADLSGGGLPSSLTFGSDGLLYGTSRLINFVAGQEGTVFSVSPLGDSVEFKIVHQFGVGTDGASPSGLTQVPAGYFNGFVGATSEGGPYGLVFGGYGTVFAQQIFAGGAGPETVLYDFPGPPNLWTPSAQPIAGTGALNKGFYGVGANGGTFNQGGAYSLTPDGAHGLTETVIYNFGAQPNDPVSGGGEPLLQISPSGTLLGSSVGGGSLMGGTLFELDPPTQAGGSWSEKVDVNFDRTNPVEGWGPIGALLRLNGQYYGALQYGAIRGYKYTGYGAIYVASP